MLWREEEKQSVKYDNLFHEKRMKRRIFGKVWWVVFFLKVLWFRFTILKEEFKWKVFQKRFLRKVYMFSNMIYNVEVWFDDYEKLYSTAWLLLSISFYVFVVLLCNMYSMAKRPKDMFIIVVHFFYHSSISLLLFIFNLFN